MKKWIKPVIITLTAAQLSQYIKAAARSGQCYNDFR